MILAGCDIMVPNKFSMVDLDGIDIVESQGVEIPGLYQKLTNAIAQCRYQVLYNWKFDSIIIPPSYVEMVVDGDEVKINDNISVSNSDIVYIHSLEPPGPEPVLVSLTATENGIYLPALGQDGFSEVNVNLSIPQPYDSSPVEDGVESPGLSNQWSRGDHVHPTDTSRQAKITASGLIVGDGAGGVSAKTLDTSSLTDDADHVPVSSVVKSALTQLESDLASIHATGSTNTTGATITAGTYFYLDGVLVKALADIASGAMFTSGTNYSVVTAGALNDPTINKKYAAYKYSGQTTTQVKFTLNGLTSGYIYWFSAMLRTPAGFAQAFIQINTDGSTSFVQQSSGANFSSVSQSGGVLTINTESGGSGIAIEQINIFDELSVLNIVPV